MNRNTSKFVGYALALVVLVAGLGLGLCGVAAQMDAPILVENETVTPTNETESIYVDATGVNDFNGSGPVNVTVTIDGLTENESVGNGTRGELSRRLRSRVYNRISRLGSRTSEPRLLGPEDSSKIQMDSPESEYE